MTTYDVVVLAGGAGRRLGGVAPNDDKAAVDVGGRTLLLRALDACRGAARLVVVGPQRDLPGARHVIWCRENPPGGGPVAALAAALTHTVAPVVVVLAVDHPFVDATKLRELVSAASGHDGAQGVDDEGRTQPLLAAYQRRALDSSLARISPHAGARVRDLVVMLDLVGVPVGVAGLDCDTPADVERARAMANSDERTP